MKNLNFEPPGKLDLEPRLLYMALFFRFFFSHRVGFLGKPAFHLDL